MSRAADASPAPNRFWTSHSWISESIGEIGLALLVLLALGGLDWIGLAPNRLLPGQGISGFRALGSWAWLTAFVTIAAVLLGQQKGPRPPAGAVFSTLLLTLTAAGLPLLTAWVAAPLLVARPPAARVWLGAGFWTALSALIVLLVVFARRTGWRLAPATACAAVAVAIIAAFAAGGLDTLSLAVEIRARGDLIAPAVVRHAMLSLGSLALALALAVSLAWSAFRWRSVEAVASAGLQAVQVVPAIALLAALVPILSLVLGAMPALRQLGMAAIGPAPAVIGVGAYLALPLVSSILAALRSADPAVVDAARGMGMSEGRITRDVRLPLGVPILVGGLRLGMVQSIGLSTLGGLIGAGGLGGIVFEGMAQFASDLILLGAAPIVVMAMTVDFGLRALEVRLATAMGGARE